jgi:hypothetical protein
MPTSAPVPKIRGFVLAGRLSNEIGAKSRWIEVAPSPGATAKTTRHVSTPDHGSWILKT